MRCSDQCVGTDGKQLLWQDISLWDAVLFHSANTSSQWEAVLVGSACPVAVSAVHVRSSVCCCWSNAPLRGSCCWLLLESAAVRVQPPSAGLPFLLFRGLAKRPFAAFAIGYRLVFRLRVGRGSSRLSLSHIHNFQLARTGPLCTVQMSLLGVGFGD